MLEKKQKYNFNKMLKIYKKKQGNENLIEKKNQQKNNMQIFKIIHIISKIE